MPRKTGDRLFLQAMLDGRTAKIRKTRQRALRLAAQQKAGSRPFSDDPLEFERVLNSRDHTLCSRVHEEY